MHYDNSDQFATGVLTYETTLHDATPGVAQALSRNIAKSTRDKDLSAIGNAIQISTYSYRLVSVVPELSGKFL